MGIDIYVCMSLHLRKRDRERERERARARARARARERARERERETERERQRDVEMEMEMTEIEVETGVEMQKNIGGSRAKMTCGDPFSYRLLSFLRYQAEGVPGPGSQREPRKKIDIGLNSCIGNMGP